MRPRAVKPSRGSVPCARVPCPCAGLWSPERLWRARVVRSSRRGGLGETGTGIAGVCATVPMRLFATAEGGRWETEHNQVGAEYGAALRCGPAVSTQFGRWPASAAAEHCRSQSEAAAGTEYLTRGVVEEKCLHCDAPLQSPRSSDGA